MPAAAPALDYVKAAIYGLPLAEQKMEDMMAWKTPKVVEIALGAEINSYACADLKK